MCRFLAGALAVAGLVLLYFSLMAPWRAPLLCIRYLSFAASAACTMSFGVLLAALSSSAAIDRVVRASHHICAAGTRLCG